MAPLRGTDPPSQERQRRPGANGTAVVENHQPANSITRKAASQGQRLNRETFSTNRLLEFCGQRELVAQTGHGVEEWPLVILKEWVDNSIDGCEEVGVAPVIEVIVDTDHGEITVTDNGPGIPPETVTSILDYSVRVSSREAYVSPTRGAQGNALKTIFAMPFALDGNVGETVIEAHGITHRICFGADPIRQEPRLTCDRSTSPVKTGNRITVRWPSKACNLLAAAKPRFLPFAWNFVGLNPHLSITATWDGEPEVTWVTTSPDWEKWRPSDPIPAHWYTPDRLQRYLAACVHRDLEHGDKVRSVRDFVAHFRGLSGTAKRAAVLETTGLARARLDVFFDGDRVDHAGIANLLTAMQQQSRAVKPEALGLIGADHFRDVFATDNADQERFKYARALGEDRNGLPFVVEAAFAPADGSPTPLVTGINFSAAIRDPFRALGPYASYFSLTDVLGRQRARSESVVVAVHVAAPSITFTDRGKSAVTVSAAIGGAVYDAVHKITKEWKAACEAQDRAILRRGRAAGREEEERRKAARIATKKRERNVTIGTGALHKEIAEAAEQSGLSINQLTVLSKDHDPYRFDTTDGHRDGAWFAQQVARFVSPEKQVHTRGLFYRIVVVGDVQRPNGQTFINNYECSEWLEWASAMARWLDYLPFERLRDERNKPPLVLAYAEILAPGVAELTTTESVIGLPEISTMLPRVSGFSPTAPQPFRIILIGEKSSLADVLKPIADRVKGTLLLFTGEASATRIAEEALRAIADARRAVVLYFADFDPAGHQMPISVARKLQALRTLKHPSLQIDFHRVALTVDQVRALNLPSTPLKPTEKRGARWREAMGHEQTEIDALLELRPDELRRIATEALQPFYDFTLDQRCKEAFEAAQAEATKKLDEHPARAAHEKRIRAAHAKAQKAINALRRAQVRAVETLRERDAGVGATEIPAPEVQIEVKPPKPFFTTDDDFVTATTKLIADKKYDFDFESEG